MILYWSNWDKQTWDSVKNINPREKILRHAEESAKNLYWIDPTYKKSGKPIFREADADEPAEKTTRTETFG